MPAWAILGAQGRLGSELVRRLGGQAAGLSRAEADFANFAGVEAALERLRPRYVINAAAYNQVDAAESRHQVALTANFSGPARLAELCRRRGWRLLHISTDYVFGGDRLNRPRRERDRPAPLNFYGYSKFAGEEAVLLRNPEAVVARVAHLFGGADPGRPDLVARFLEQASKGAPLWVPRGQWLNPTDVPELARACVALLRGGARGLIHLTGAEPCPAEEFVAAVLRHAGLTAELRQVERDTRPAPRAPNTVLASPAYPHPGVRGVPGWKRRLGAYVGEIQQRSGS